VLEKWNTDSFFQDESMKGGKLRNEEKSLAADGK